MKHIRGLIELRHIHYVVAAADHGSFRKAAIALGVGESAVSRKIRELEERLGTTFFIRSPSGVKLSNAGEHFVRRGRKALFEIRLAISEVSAIGRGENGRLSIGIFTSLASGFLSDLISIFTKQNSNIKMAFIDGDPENHLSAIRLNELDVAFMVGAKRWPGFESQHLWSERIFVVLPSDHPRAGDFDIRFNELSDELFIVTEAAPGEQIHNFLMQRLANLGKNPEIHQHAVGRDNLMQLVALGRGLTVTNEAATAARFPNVAFVPIDDEILPFSAVWSPNNENAALIGLLELARSMSSVNDPSAFGILFPDNEGGNSQEAVAAVGQVTNPIVRCPKNGK